MQPFASASIVRDFRQLCFSRCCGCLANTLASSVRSFRQLCCSRCCGCLANALALSVRSFRQLCCSRCCGCLANALASSVRSFRQLCSSRCCDCLANASAPSIRSFWSLCKPSSCRTRSVSLMLCRFLFGLDISWRSHSLSMWRFSPNAASSLFRRHHLFIKKKIYIFKPRPRNNNHTGRSITLACPYVRGPEVRISQSRLFAISF